MLIQTWALIVDAYRELNARKLFWITLILTALVVLVCAMIGIDSRGISFLWFDLPFPVSTEQMPARVFYLVLFSSFGLGLWLTWIATILALISTAGIIPDLIAGGSIETMLSKPISRLRLFFTKYCCGLLFMALQLLVFCGGFFLLMGLRGGTWQPGVFLAIPIVLLFFSYLFSVCVLLGMITRSTVASLLITLLLWLGLFAINATDVIMVQLRAAAEFRLSDAEERLANEQVIAEKEVALRRRDGEPIPGENGVPLTDGAATVFESVNPRLINRARAVPEAEDDLRKARAWEGRVFAVKTILPKTSETIALLDRNLLRDDDLDRMMDQEPADEEVLGTMADPRAARRVQDIIRARSVGWVIGTSLAFEAVMLAVAGWLFVRRDF